MGGARIPGRSACGPYRASGVEGGLFVVNVALSGGSRWEARPGVAWAGV
jgi:hypothetical protein